MYLIFVKYDINNGGEGAPLAPIFHDYIFNHNNKDRRIIINIGGISNISFLTDGINNLFGFDSGPWEYFNRYHGLTRSITRIMILMVRLSSEYSCSEKLLEIFMNDKYFQKNFPKSTSTEYFNYDWINSKLKLANSDFSDGDILATLTKLHCFFYCSKH